MAIRRWDAAPNPEWALMYRRGLTRRQIVELTGAADRTVAYHLAAAKTQDPGLEDEHGNDPSTTLYPIVAAHQKPDPAAKDSLPSGHRL